MNTEHGKQSPSSLSQPMISINAAVYFDVLSTAAGLFMGLFGYRFYRPCLFLSGYVALPVGLLDSAGSSGI